MRAAARAHGRLVHPPARLPARAPSGAGAGAAASTGFHESSALDTGQLRLHYRAPPGTRIERTEQQVMEVEREVRRLADGDVEGIVDNLGIPVSYNLGFVSTSNAGGEDAEIRISLRPGHRPSARLQDRIRAELPPRFPGAELWFEPADVVTQVLSFGLPAQLEIQVQGRDPQAALDVARRAIAAVRRVPGAVDAHLAQVFDRPALQVDVDRQQAQGLGLFLAIALVYLLLVVLFQSWADPLIILVAVPGALLGILWFLSITGTTLNVESFMGAIMAVGIATSNSILLVSFANDFRDALVSRGDRLQVATIRSGRLHFVDVVPGETDGRTLQIREGLDPGEVAVLSPPSDLGEGAPVQAVPREGPGSAGQARADGAPPRHVAR